MSAFDKVRESYAVAQQAMAAFNEKKDAYQSVVTRAADAIFEGKLDVAKNQLDSIGFTKDGEDPNAYRVLWMGMIPNMRSGNRTLANPLQSWRFIKEVAPLNETTCISGFFGSVLATGSTEVLRDLLPLYEKAGDKWHYNWDVGTLFGRSENLKGREDDLLERLSCVDLLVVEGAKTNRLMPALEKIATYAKQSEELKLSDRTLQAMTNTYLNVMAVFVKDDRRMIFDEYHKHLAPPKQLGEAHEKYNEHSSQISMRNSIQSLRP